MNPFEKYVNETFEMLNERSINKINKDFTDTVSTMAQKAIEYKEAEGDAKAAILAELKELTAKKKELAKELDKAVAGKDKNIELAITEKILFEATVEMDAMDPDNKDFLKFLKKNRVEIIDKMMDGPAGGNPVITMQGKRKDLENVLSNCDYGWCDEELAEYIEESVVNEAKKLDKKSTIAIAQKIADIFTQESADEKEYIKYTVNPDVSSMSFDLDAEPTAKTPKKIADNPNYFGEYAGGSLYIKDNGEEFVVYNAALGSAEIERFTYAGELIESVVTEGKKVTLKRRYTENHPAVTAGKHAKIRNKVLEAIKDGKITQEEFDKIVSELSNNSKRWTKNNSKYFTVSEDGISLSKFGRRVLSGITVNEKTTKNPEIWVPGGFDKELSKMPNSKINMDVVSKLARKHEVDLDDAIAYVEYGWDLDLNENKTNMKTQFIYESFSEFVNSLNESALNENDAKTIVNAFTDYYKKRDEVTADDWEQFIYDWTVMGDGGDELESSEIEWDTVDDVLTMLDKKGYKKIDVEGIIQLYENTLNEAFASSKLASILTGGNKMDKDLPKAFYQMAKIALDKIQDVDIIEMDPATAKKEKRANAIYMYFTTNAKENPYAGNSAWREEKEIPANTLLAITNGQNEWMATEWQRTYNRSQKATRVLKTTKRDDSAGIAKSGARSEYGSGISSMKQVAALADRAYCLDLDILRARYSTTAQRDERAAAKKGAIAFQNDKDFKAENLNRYNTIIANRAAKMPIDKMVADAIDTISKQIKDALAKGEKTRYNEILIGTSSKGREAKITDAASHMQRILDDFQRYVEYTNKAEQEKKSGYGGDYYAREVKNYAKNITDKIKQIESFGYAW
jgi:hypothetical protein